MSALTSDLPPVTHYPSASGVQARRNTAAERIQKEALNQLGAGQGHARASSAPVKRTQAEWIAIMHQKKGKKKSDGAKPKQAREHPQNVVHVPRKEKYSRFDTQLPIGPKDASHTSDFSGGSMIPAGHSDTILVQGASPSNSEAASRSPTGELVPLTIFEQPNYDSNANSSDGAALNGGKRRSMGQLIAQCCLWINQKC